MPNNHISERIKQRRLEIRRTQKEIAEMVGVSLVTITRWENPTSGRTPNSALLAKLADALETSVDYLMGTKKEKTPEIIIEHRKEEQPLRIIYDYGNHHFDLPATPEGYKAFNEVLSVMSRMNTPAAVGA